MAINLSPNCRQIYLQVFNTPEYLHTESYRIFCSQYQTNRLIFLLLLVCLIKFSIMCVWFSEKRNKTTLVNVDKYTRSCLKLLFVFLFVVVQVIFHNMYFFHQRKIWRSTFQSKYYIAVGFIFSYSFHTALQKILNSRNAIQNFYMNFYVMINVICLFKGLLFCQ